MSDVLKPQPPPKPSEEPSAWDLVMADMQARDGFGAQKSGVRLTPGDGRDPLVDAYQEVLNLALCLRKEIHERAQDDLQTIKRQRDAAMELAKRGLEAFAGALAAVERLRPYIDDAEHGPACDDDPQDWCECGLTQTERSVWMMRHFKSRLGLKTDAPPPEGWVEAALAKAREGR